MNERCTIAVMQQIEPHTATPFRLVETYMSTDGFRSRICNGSWATFDEAEADRQKRIKPRSS